MSKRIAEAEYRFWFVRAWPAYGWTPSEALRAKMVANVIGFASI
jgi:hypothetical protein